METSVNYQSFFKTHEEVTNLQETKEFIMEHKDVIRSLYKDGFIDKKESNFLIKKCNQIIKSDDFDEVLNIILDHPLVSLNLNLIYRTDLLNK